MNKSNLKPVDETPSVLLIGGVDSSGGAGLAIDLGVIRTLGLHGLPVASAVTAQNSRGVHKIHVTPSDVMQAQLDAVGAEFQIGAVKLSMLGSPGNVEVITAWLRDRPRLPVVLDPILKATSGGVLTPEGLSQTLRKNLFPRVRVLTPNLDELSRYTGHAVKTREDIPPVARLLLKEGCQWVLAKGGHLRGPYAADFLCGETELWLEGERSSHSHVRGTGCALSTALACGLARGETVVDAAWKAKGLVSKGLDLSYIAGEDRHLYFD